MDGGVPHRYELTPLGDLGHPASSTGTPAKVADGRCREDDPQEREGARQSSPVELDDVEAACLHGRLGVVVHAW